MDILWFLQENWPEIVLGALNVAGIFMYFLNNRKVGKTGKMLHMSFGAQRKEIAEENAALRERAAAAAAEAKEVAECIKRDLEEQRAAHEAEMKKYRQSLIEITQSDPVLVAKGVAEKVTKRFTEKEDSVDVNQ